MTDEIFRQDSYARSCQATVTAVEPEGVRLDRTVFYPLGGGQPGDTGVLRTADGRAVRIKETLKHKASGEPLHVPEPGSPALAVGDQVVAELDWPRRYRHMRVHSCLHVLSALVKGGVTGGAVGDGKGRLDFDLPDQSLDKDRLEADLNRLVAENHPVSARWISDAELAANPELVRTMSVKPPSGQGWVRLLEIAGVDLQPCGGTHVRATGEIGRVRIAKIESKGRRNRRVNVILADEGSGTA